MLGRTKAPLPDVTLPVVELEPLENPPDAPAELPETPPLPPKNCSLLWKLFDEFWVEPF